MLRSAYHTSRDRTLWMTQAKSLPSGNVKSSRVDRDRLVNEHVASWEGSFQGPLVCPSPSYCCQTFCSFPQLMTDGCVVQETISLAQGKLTQRSTFWSKGPKGKKRPDNTRACVCASLFMSWFAYLSPLQALSETSPPGSSSLHKNLQAFLLGKQYRAGR